MKKKYIIDRILSSSNNIKQQAGLGKKLNIENKKNQYYNKGNELVVDTQQSLWRQWVDDSFSCVYQGQDFEYAIKILEKLKNGGNIEDVKAILTKANLPTHTYASVLEILATFERQDTKIFRQLKYELLTVNIRQDSEKLKEC